MKPTHSEDLECLRRIRGCFGSRRIFCVEYEFTGEQIIERRGGRIKKEINISDVIETKVKFGRPNQMIVTTPGTTMKIQVIPSLNKAVQRVWAEESSKMTESERQRFEDAKAELVSRVKRMNVIGAIILLFTVFVIFCFFAWLKKAH
jgi:hypothetical protein